MINPMVYTGGAWQLQVKINEKLYLRDPQQSELGLRILNKGVKLLEELGLEEFTFRKLAHQLSTNESSIYRYFENKHRLLLYLTQWYWSWMEFQLVTRVQSFSSSVEKVDALVNLLMMSNEGTLADPAGIDKRALHRVVLREASKAYLTRQVFEDNRNQFFKPYKSFCARVADVILEYTPGYRFPRSLASTVIEMSHYQYFFMHNLPSLTDFGESRSEQQIHHFLRSLILQTRNFSDEKTF